MSQEHQVAVTFPLSRPKRAAIELRVGRGQLGDTTVNRVPRHGIDRLHEYASPFSRHRLAVLLLESA